MSVQKNRGWRVLARWVADQGIEHWPTIVSLVLASGVGYLAAGAQWLNPYGPVAWAFVALAAFLLIALAFWLYSSARQKLGMARYVDRHAESATVNPLQRTFERQRLKLSDFYHPFYRPNRGARFEDCELLGPAHIFVINSVIKNSGFWDCEVVLAKDGASVIGVTGFADCYFDRCNFFRVTLYMTKETYQAMKANGAAPPVISDGKAGDL